MFAVDPGQFQLRSHKNVIVNPLPGSSGPGGVADLPRNNLVGVVVNQSVAGPQARVQSEDGLGQIEPGGASRRVRSQFTRRSSRARWRKHSTRWSSRRAKRCRGGRRKSSTGRSPPKKWSSSGLVRKLSSSASKKNLSLRKQ